VVVAYPSLHLQGVDAAGTPVSAWFTNPITGAFVALPLIDEAAFWGFIQAQWASYRAFRVEQPRQARRLLGLLLNASSADDFLELRGSKVVGIVDALTSMVLPPQAPKFPSNRLRRAFLSAVREHIRIEAAQYLLPDPDDAPGRRERWGEEMARKATDIVRLSFRELIVQMYAVLRIDIDEAALEYFIVSRNELIHEARFVCQREDPEHPPAGWPFATPAEEYFWLLRFVDRLVLRKLDYRGPFVDRCRRDGSQVAAEA
jgi:hypothetical protein